MPKKVATHQPKKTPKPKRKRVSASKKGYDSKWRRFRLQWLRRNPLCKHCEAEGKLVAGHHVDHIIPVTGPKDPNFYKKGNHQSLCTSHHAKKSMQDRINFGKKFGKK